MSHRFATRRYRDSHAYSLHLGAIADSSLSCSIVQVHRLRENGTLDDGCLRDETRFLYGKSRAGPARARVPLAIGDDQKLCQEQRARPRQTAMVYTYDSVYTPTSVPWCYHDTGTDKSVHDLCVCVYATATYADGIYRVGEREERRSRGSWWTGAIALFIWIVCKILRARASALSLSLSRNKQSVTLPFVCFPSVWSSRPSRESPHPRFASQMRLRVSRSRSLTWCDEPNGIETQWLLLQNKIL